jgi:phosphate transport system protein
MDAHSSRETFDRRLQTLLDEVLVLGSMAEQAVFASVQALKQRDLEASRRIFKDDLKINERRYKIENSVLVLIATQQPMARDLRFLAAVLEIITELERIGDYAKGISKINLLIGEEAEIKLIPEIPQMSELATGMLHRALTALVSRDVEIARQIPDEDDAIDELYHKALHELVELMVASPTIVFQANYLLWAAHNLERVGDRVTNICERIVFAATGEMMEMDRPLDPDDIKAGHTSV